MYEQCIEVLSAPHRFTAAVRRVAFEAAIDLMRAAEPKAAPVERRHCVDVIDETGLVKVLGAEAVHKVWLDMLMRERAAARAEGHAQARDAWIDADLEGQLADAKAEIKRLRDELSRMSENSRGFKNVLETKLTNLRAAAERALAEWEAPYPEPEESDAALRAAIEASS